METGNFSEDGKQKTIIQLFCSASVTAEIHGQLALISVLNIFLCFTAFLGNTLILVALRKESSLHSPSKLLLRSLAATDLCVSLTTEPLAVTVWMSAINEHWDVCRYASFAGFVTGSTLARVSLLTLTAISVDRLLALLLGLRYRHVVTLKRTYVVVITFWVVPTAVSAIWFWNSVIARWSSFMVASLCLVTSIFSYTKVFLTLRHHQTQVQDHVQQQSQTNPLNIARYRKAVSSALWLQLTLVACYLPDVLVGALASSTEQLLSVFIARQYTVTLVCLNSSLNPILYCWKIEEVKQAVKETIKKLLCCLSN